MNMDKDNSYEIPFGTKDSELKGWEYTIPEGMEAEIKDGKIIVRGKESADERIRKRLIEWVEEFRKLNPTNADHNAECSEAITWLEKQGSQNLANSYCQENCKGFQETGRCFADGECKAKREAEQNPADKIESKFKVGDVIVEIKPNCYCPPVRVKYIGEEAYSCESDDGTRSLSFPIISQDEYKLVGQNSAWSEEDEKTTQRIVDTIMKYAISPHSIINGDKPNLEYAKEFESWLKSLKFRIQPQWKPSDEQLEALDDFIYAKYPNTEKHGAAVKSLYQDLKNLKG